MELSCDSRHRALMRERGALRSSASARAERIERWRRSARLGFAAFAGRRCRGGLWLLGAGPRGAAQAREQFGGGPAIGRQAELDLHVADRLTALQAEHAVDASHVVAALLQQLLQLARI